LAPGDGNFFYFLGRRFGPRRADRLLRRERAQERYRWVERHVMSRGSTIVIVGRFIPGGRTATTFACGTVGFPYRRSLPAAVGAGVLRRRSASPGQEFPRRTLGAAADRAWNAFLLALAAEALRRGYGTDGEGRGDRGGVRDRRRRER
jgi:membrane-associated protein